MSKNTRVENAPTRGSEYHNIGLNNVIRIVRVIAFCEMPAPITPKCLRRAGLRKLLAADCDFVIVNFNYRI